MFILKRRSTLKTGLLLVVTMLAAYGTPASAATTEPLKVAWVYNGPIGEAGWSFAHDKARKEVEAYFGDKIKGTYVEKVPESADAERVFRDLASQGNKLIFGTSFGYMEAMLKVAKEFPDVKFEHATGYKRAPNLAQYDSKTFQGPYLEGIIAGKMTKTNKLGFVASFPIPEVIRNMDAFTLGALSVNPNVTTRAVWISTWFDPAKERDAALAMIGQGVDVLAQNTDSVAVVQVAEEKGVYAFGIDSDMSRWGPKAHLGSAIINWAPYYKQSIQSVLDGKWTNGESWWGFKEGAVDVVSINAAVPAETKKLVEEKKAAIAAGTFDVFTGPVVDASGKEMLAAGQVADVPFLKGLNFYVKGVQGSIPK